MQQYSCAGAMLLVIVAEAMVTVKIAKRIRAFVFVTTSRRFFVQQYLPHPTKECINVMRAWNHVQSVILFTNKIKNHYVVNTPLCTSQHINTKHIENEWKQYTALDFYTIAKRNYKKQQQQLQ